MHHFVIRRKILNSLLGRYIFILKVIYLQGRSFEIFSCLIFFSYYRFSVFLLINESILDSFTFEEIHQYKNITNLMLKVIKVKFQNKKYKCENRLRSSFRCAAIIEKPFFKVTIVGLSCSSPPERERLIIQLEHDRKHDISSSKYCYFEEREKIFQPIGLCPIM